MPAAPTSPSPLELEQLAQLIRTTPAAWLLSTLGAVVCYMSFAQEPAWALRLWLISFCVVSGVRLLLALYVVRFRPSALSSARGLHAWLASTYVHAAQWGLLSLVLAKPGSAQAEAILHITLAAIAMGGSVRLPGFHRVLRAHVLLVLGPLVLRDLLTRDPHLALLALLVFLIGAYSLLSGRNQSRALHEIQTQRRRNAELIEALRQENERSEAALLAAEQASAARTRFFAAANHDLRQPLHAMGLLAETLLAREASGPSAAMTAQLGDCVVAMREVVDDLLDITRLDGGSRAVQWAVFDAGELIHECCRPFALSAQAQGLRFVVQAEPVRVRSDRALLHRVLTNLVANALRYTPQGSVEVRTQVRGAWLEVQVLDTGIGIAEEHQARIFEEFYQVGNPARDRRLGLGLGLATVKRLGELLDLRLALQSAPGHGSRFSFVLPILADAAAAAEAAAPPAAAPLPGRCVLVVEDDAASRAALIGLLQSWGSPARGVAALAEGLALIEGGFEPHALVVDLRLADGASGIDAVQALRARLGAETAALIVTGDVGSEAMLRAQSLGLPVMVKPLQARQLRAFLAQAFATPEASAPV